MIYIDIEAGVFTHPETGKQVSIHMEEIDHWFLHFDYYGNDVPFKLLGVDKTEYCVDHGVNVHEGCWPEMDNPQDIYKIVEALNRDLFRKFYLKQITITDLPW